jgi:AcrR family transcriptional regulator
MGRRPQPYIKNRLLDGCADYALAHGLPDRLEPLATATGTSARMLIYHFGTCDALLRAVLGHARQRQLDTFGDLLRVRPRRSRAPVQRRPLNRVFPDYAARPRHPARHPRTRVTNG